MAVLAVTGPWSAYNISKPEQPVRSSEKYQMIENGRIVKAAGDLANEDKREISHNKVF